jgi:TonB family protein
MDVQASRPTDVWKQWQGEMLNGKFRLLEYLGGSDHSAVFLTSNGENEKRKLAVKMIAEDPQVADLQLSPREVARKLSHPHLIRLCGSGRAEIANTPVLYVVMDYAGEDLSQILPYRPLTAGEVEEMLPSVLDVLGHIHNKGLVHGHIKPSNIMAVDDELKVSSDGLGEQGEPTRGLEKASPYSAPEIKNTGMSPAGDVWSLGVTLVECLTQHVPVWELGKPRIPDTLPQPFLEIARNCLQIDPRRRWTLADIKARLQPNSRVGAERVTPAAPEKKPSKWPYILAAAAAVVLLAVLAMRAPKRRPEIPQTPPSTPQRLPIKAVTPGTVHGAVVNQAIPQVPESARQTIQGTVRVTVRVAVDASGDVSGATIDSPGPSKYFAGLALQAARQWKFSPAKVDGRDVPSEWILRYHFEGSGTKVFPVQASP